MVGDNPVNERLDGIVVADVTGPELERRFLDRAARARHDGGALVGEDPADAGADAAHTSGDEHDPAVERETDCALVTRAGDGTVGGVSHCASVPSKCLLR